MFDRKRIFAVGYSLEAIIPYFKELEKEDDEKKIIEFAANPQMLRQIYDKHTTAYLLTDTSQVNTVRRLKSAHIPLSVFNQKIYGDILQTKKGELLFEYLLTQTDVNSKYHVYIGSNRERDILPAKKYGMQTIFVGKDKVSEADLCVTDISKLERIFL